MSHCTHPSCLNSFSWEEKRPLATNSWWNAWCPTWGTEDPVLSSEKTLKNATASPFPAFFSGNQHLFASISWTQRLAHPLVTQLPWPYPGVSFSQSLCHTSVGDTSCQRLRILTLFHTFCLWACLAYMVRPVSVHCSLFLVSCVRKRGQCPPAW